MGEGESAHHPDEHVRQTVLRLGREGRVREREGGTMIAVITFITAQISIPSSYRHYISDYTVGTLDWTLGSRYSS